jgi:tRNA (cmo5U34)-methyltransferase
MADPFAEKSSVEAIRARFDADVERFANLETGQSAAMDSPLCLELVARASLAVRPGATHLLDIGCGAGNYAVRLLRDFPGLACTLVDLSAPMLERARERAAAAGATAVTTHQADIRELALPSGAFSIAVAGAALHHLRAALEWDAVFGKVHEALEPGGCFWIIDLLDAEHPGVRKLLRRRYREHLVALGGQAYAEKVFAYSDREDTPRPLAWQLERLRAAGFASVDVLHQHGPFAAFGAVKANGGG